MITLSASISALVRVISRLSLELRGMSQSTGVEDTSRKRKMASVDGEELGTSGGDARTTSPKAKQSRADLPDEEPDQEMEEVPGPSHPGDQFLHPPCHKHKVRIRETDLLAGGRLRNIATSSADPKDSRRLVEFTCDIMDHWVDIYPRLGKIERPDVSTGDYFTDKVLPAVESKGYTIVQELERGRFGSILLAHSASIEKYVALKFIINNVKRKLRQPAGDNLTAHDQWECVINDEIVIQEGLKHSNVVQMLEYFCISGRLCMALEFCETGNLELLLEATTSGLLTENVAKRYLGHMLSAVEYIHTQDVVHRDIKCQNFLLDHRDCVKLCDFRTARKYPIGSPKLRDRCGSPGYQAPEILEEKPHDPRATDRWAVGVILYKMVTSRLPFGTDPAEAIIAIRAGVDYGEVKAVHLPEELRALLRGMLHYVVVERYTVNRVRQSDWFKQHSRLSIGNHHMVRQPQKLWSRALALPEVDVIQSKDPPK